jgi:hypothetical protein
MLIPIPIPTVCDAMVSVREDVQIVFDKDKSIEE